MLVFSFLGVLCARESLPWQPPVKTFPFPFLHFLFDPLPACEGNVMTHSIHIFGEQESSGGNEMHHLDEMRGCWVFEWKDDNFSEYSDLSGIHHAYRSLCVRVKQEFSTFLIKMFINRHYLNSRRNQLRFCSILLMSAAHALKVVQSCLQPSFVSTKSEGIQKWRQYFCCGNFPKRVQRSSLPRLH